VSVKKIDKLVMRLFLLVNCPSMHVILAVLQLCMGRYKRVCCFFSACYIVDVTIIIIIVVVVVVFMK